MSVSSDRRILRAADFYGEAVHWLRDCRFSAHWNDIKDGVGKVIEAHRLIALASLSSSVTSIFSW